MNYAYTDLVLYFIAGAASVALPFVGLWLVGAIKTFFGVASEIRS